MLKRIRLFCCLITLLLLLSVLFIKGKISFPWVAVCFFLLCVTHYLTILLAPSLVYLVYREWKKNGLQNIVIGTAAIAIGVFITLWLADFNTDQSYSIGAVQALPFLIEEYRKIRVGIPGIHTDFVVSPDRPPQFAGFTGSCRILSYRSSVSFAIKRLF